MVLTIKELRELTRRERPAAQARVLRQLEIPFRIHPTDGVLIVARDAAASRLGALPISDVEAPQRYEVDIRGIKRHGKTTPSR